MNQKAIFGEQTNAPKWTRVARDSNRRHKATITYFDEYIPVRSAIGGQRRQIRHLVNFVFHSFVRSFTIDDSNNNNNNHAGSIYQRPIPPAIHTATAAATSAY